MKLSWSPMHFTNCFLADLTFYRSLALLTYGYWLGKRGFFAVYACTVGIQFNSEKTRSRKKDEEGAC